MNLCVIDGPTATQPCHKETVPQPTTARPEAVLACSFDGTATRHESDLLEVGGKESARSTTCAQSRYEYATQQCLMIAPRM